MEIIFNIRERERWENSTFVCKGDTVVNEQSWGHLSVLVAGCWGKRDTLQTGTQAFQDAADSSLLFLSGVSVLLLRKLGGDRGAD